MKIKTYRKLGFCTAISATIFCGFGLGSAILEEGISQFSLEAWLIVGAGIFVLGAVWFIVIIMPNE